LQRHAQAAGRGLHARGEQVAGVRNAVPRRWVVPGSPHGRQLEDDVVSPAILVRILIDMTIEQVKRRMVERCLTTLHAPVGERFQEPHQRGQVVVFTGMVLRDAGLLWQTAIWGFTVRQSQRQDGSSGIAVAVSHAGERVRLVAIRAGARVVAAGAGGPVGVAVAGAGDVTPVAAAVIERFSLACTAHIAGKWPPPREAAAHPVHLIGNRSRASSPAANPDSRPS
jgi:hypothetical protein